MKTVKEQQIKWWSVHIAVAEDVLAEDDVGVGRQSAVVNAFN
jgi:hypothetical protein